MLVSAVRSSPWAPSPFLAIPLYSRLIERIRLRAKIFGNHGAEPTHDSRTLQSREWKMTAAVAQGLAATTAQPAGSPASIRVRGLSKRFGTLEVFRGVDFDLGEREIVTIVGPSGCGKTTLLRCIDGLLSVDEGEIWCGRERVTKPIAGMAMVFQNFGLFPWKTVYDNVAYGLRMAGATAAQIAEQVPRFIKLVGLGGFEQAYPYQMSG